MMLYEKENMRGIHHLIWNDWNVEHIALHGVTPDEVEQVVFSRDKMIRRGKDKSVYYIFGQTDSGRYLFIVVKEVSSDTGWTITARDMSDRERKLYKR